jgi:4-aminobutyrate aminotransferase
VNSRKPPVDATHLGEVSRTEGDVNISTHRRHWAAEHVHAETAEWLARDSGAFLHQSLSTPCLNAVRGAEGIYLIDEEGRRIIDFHGNSAHQVGYGHPRVREAVKRQLDELSFCPRRYTNRPAIELAETLGRLAPGRLNKVLFAPGGTSAVGIALKLVRHATKRFKMIGMWDAFHGASLDAISVGGESLFRRDAGPLLPGVEHVPPPSPGNCPFGCEGNCTLRCADCLEYVLEKEGDIAGVIAEPVRATTVVVPPAEYWRRVRRACDRHGALLVMDEIPTGLGWTGRMFCCEHFGVEPDILVIGKGLGGAVFPMAAAIVRDDLDIAHDRALGHYTHEKSPLGAAAGLALIGCLEQDGLVAGAEQLGRYALERLRALQARYAIIREVRGLGLLLAVELVRPGGAKATDEAERVLYGCLRRGLSFKVSDGNVLNWTVPLVVARQQLDEAADILAAALSEIPPASGVELSGRHGE